MARAAVLLDRGGRVGARPVVRRVLDRAAPELLGELAADLGLGEEDRPAVARRPAEVLYRVSPRGQRCGCARFRRRGGRDRWARAAPRRRPRVGGAVTVAARSRPTSPAGAGSTTSRSATNPPPATPSTMTHRGVQVGRTPQLDRVAAECVAARKPAASCGGCGKAPPRPAARRLRPSWRSTKRASRPPRRVAGAGTDPPADRAPPACAALGAPHTGACTRSPSAVHEPPTRPDPCLSPPADTSRSAPVTNL